jgi:hypothetical protein
MPTYDRMTTETIFSIFCEEIAALGGSVKNTFNDGDRLFTRSVLPAVREVRPGDCMQGGVALRADAADAWVHPYLFRQVCTNGAIMARAIESRRIAISSREPEYAAASIRETIQACAANETFEDAAGKVGSPDNARAGSEIALLPLLARWSTRKGSNSQAFQTIFRRFLNDDDHSHFGLMNAVTSVARDTDDPDLRWRLEALGGDIGTGQLPEHHVDQTHSQSMIEALERMSDRHQDSLFRQDFEMERLAVA